MNYPRVNLLKKDEQRYQGAVSQRFILVSMVVIPVLFIAILSGVKLLQYGSVQSNLKSSREIWVSLEPRLERFKVQQRQLNDNRKILEIIQGWKDSQIPMDGLLLNIQQAIPGEIQLTRVSIRSEVKTSVYNNVGELDLDYHLTVQGVSQGDRAEDEVIDLRKSLLKEEQIAATFTSLKLASMRKRDGQNGESFREFSLEGMDSQGEVQK